MSRFSPSDGPEQREADRREAAERDAELYNVAAEYAAWEALEAYRERQSDDLTDTLRDILMPVQL